MNSNGDWLIVDLIVWSMILALAFYFTMVQIEDNNTHLEYKITELENQIKQNKVEVIDRLKQLHVTSYSPTKSQCDADPHITASMLPVKEGTIAVSRDLFNDGWVFGRCVYIEGLGVYEIRDLMNKRYTNRIDIFRWSKKKALRFGKKNLAVALLNI